MYEHWLLITNYITQGNPGIIELIQPSKIHLQFFCIECKRVKDQKNHHILLFKILDDERKETYHYHIYSALKMLFRYFLELSF
jgi:hypothetical protein